MLDARRRRGGRCEYGGGVCESVEPHQRPQRALRSHPPKPCGVPRTQGERCGACDNDSWRPAARGSRRRRCYCLLAESATGDGAAHLLAADGDLALVAAADLAHANVRDLLRLGRSRFHGHRPRRSAHRNRCRGEVPSPPASLSFRAPHRLLRAARTGECRLLRRAGRPPTPPRHVSTSAPRGTPPGPVAQHAPMQRRNGPHGRRAPRCTWPWCWLGVDWE